MKKRNILLFSAIAAASITMAGCGFSAEDPADSQAVSITPEAEVTATPAPTATLAPTATPAPTVTPAAGASGTDAAGTAAADGTTTDGTASDGSTSADGTSTTDASTGTDTSSDASAAGTGAASGDASSAVGNSFTSFMDTYGSPIEYEPAYDANGNEVGGVYSYNDFSVTTDFTSGSEVVAAVDYY